MSATAQSVSVSAQGLTKMAEELYAIAQLFKTDGAPATKRLRIAA